MKTAALERVLNEAQASIQTITLVTNWKPEDVAAGASDLDVLSLAQATPCCRLLIHPHLHAKYFRGDNACLVGSANLTHRGLGWAVPSNLELLVELPLDHPRIKAWEAALVAASVPATEALRNEIARAAARLPGRSNIGEAEAEKAGQPVETPSTTWLPRCPVPEYLWAIYSGHRTDGIVASAVEAARLDLEALEIPRGLSHDHFELYVASVLRQMPLVAEIDRLAQRGLRDSDAEALLQNRGALAPDASPSSAWRITKEWLMHFFPRDYRLQVGQEVLVRGREI